MTRRTIPGQNPGKPTAEAVADALIQYETGGICHYGQTCGLCDCGRADQTPEQTQTRDAMELDRARAVLALIPPQRCAPSEDEVAAEIRLAFRSAYEVGTPDPTRVAVRAIAKLYADQPTVAQAKAEEALLLTGHEDKGRGFDQLLMRQLADPEVRASYVAAQLRRIKAEALREAADELDSDAAEGRTARRIADVRCMRCDLRHEEREEYSCRIEGTAHDYDEAELAEAARPDGETSWIGDRLRARAAAIESGAEHG